MKKRIFLLTILSLLAAMLLLAGCEDTDGGALCADGAHTLDEITVIEAASCTAEGSAKRTCSVCHGMEESYALPATGHDFGELEVQTAASCTAAGSGTRTCATCGESETVAIAATGHSYGAAVTQTAPGCLTTGTAKRTCTVCADVQTVTLPATGHTEGAWQLDTAAKCLSAGSQHKSCTVCGATVKTEVLAATGHTEGAWQLDTAATCLSAGSQHKSCTVCGATVKTELIAATGHVAGAWNEIPLAGGGVADYMELHCASCTNLIRTAKKEDVVVCSADTVTLNLSGYRLIYPENASDAFKQQLVALAEAISVKTGVQIGVSPDTRAAVAKEILVGSVDRAQVAAAMQSVTGVGYTVQVIDKRIVIAGSTDLIALMGVRYFTQSYLQDTSKSSVTMPISSVSDRYNTVTLADGQGIYYRPTHEADLDTDGVYHNNLDPLTEYGQINLGTGRDYAYDAALAIRDALIAANGGGTVTLKTDAAASAVEEILIGHADRTQIASFLATIGGGDYGIAVRDGRVLVTGWSAEALVKAATMMQGYLHSSVYEGQNGAKSIILPVNFTWSACANDYWYTTFPKPDGLPLYNTEDVGDSSLQYLYMGEGVNATAYLAYRQKLAAHGYTVLTESALEDSYFATLVNADGTVMLQVSYNAYKNKNSLPTGQEFPYDSPAIRVISARVNATHADYPKSGSYDQSVPASDTIQRIYYGSRFTYTYFNTNYRTLLTNAGYVLRARQDNAAGETVLYTAVHPTTGACILVEFFPTYERRNSSDAVTYSGTAMRVVFRARGVINPPTAELLQPQAYTKRTDSAITAVALAGDAVGTSYVITLEDGRFIVIDGGGAASNSPERLWNVLVDLHTKIWGEEPTEAHPVVIAAWLFTHSHGDHFNAFWDFSNFYGGGNGANSKTEGKALVKLEYLVANIPEVSTLYNTGESQLTLRVEMTKILGYYKHGFTFLKVHTGQKLQFANVQIHMLYTHGDLHPFQAFAFNETSTNFRLSIKPTGGTAKTFLATGDTYIYSARWMCAMYGEALHSDMVTMTHHGGPGTENTFYDLVAPDVIWWPHTKGAVYNTYLKSTNWFCKVDQHAFYLPSVDYVFISDDYNITLFLRATGPDYDNLYAAAGDGATISYYELPVSPSNEQKSALRSAKPVAVKKV